MALGADGLLHLDQVVCRSPLVARVMFYSGAFFLVPYYSQHSLLGLFLKFTLEFESSWQHVGGLQPLSSCSGT